MGTPYVTISYNNILYIKKITKVNYYANCKKKKNN